VALVAPVDLANARAFADAFALAEPFDARHDDGHGGLDGAHNALLGWSVPLFGVGLRSGATRIAFAWVLPPINSPQRIASAVSAVQRTNERTSNRGCSRDVRMPFFG
jgi:hypothetical protein